MRRNRLLATAAAALAAPAVIAHHSPAAYDIRKEITIEGTVSELEWANPHAYLSLREESADGRTWLVELISPSALRQFGWTASTLAVGDRVKVIVSPSRNPASRAAFMHAIEKSGTMLVDTRGSIPASGAVAEGATNGSSPDPASTAHATSLAGTWATLPGPAFLQLLPNSAALPTTPRGAAAIRDFEDAASNPGQDCVPFPPPVYMVLPVFRRIEITGDTVLIRGEEGGVDRTIDMSRATHEGATPSVLGDSIGRFEGDVLVVDTTHFAEHRLGNGGGLPSSPRKHLVERFELAPGGGSLRYTFVLEDPEFLTAPVQGTSEWTYRPDVEYAPIECSLENARRFLEEGA